jgi:hypothetical protein
LPLTVADGQRLIVALVLLNTLLTFENRWPGFGVLFMPRLSFELCLGLAALVVWLKWRGRLGVRALSWLAAAFVGLCVVRYADVTIPAVLGRPVNVYWDGRHAAELLRVAARSMGTAEMAVALGALLLGATLLWAVVRWAIQSVATGLQRPIFMPWVLGGVTALSASFVAYVPGERDTRWFFSLPLSPTIADQARLLARVAWPDREAEVLGPSPAFNGGLDGLRGARGSSDVLIIFAESYGAVTFDQPHMAQPLAAARSELARTIAFSGRQVASARVTAPTFGGASWLSHATLLSGVNTADPSHHQLLLASQRPTLVSHFANQGYRTVGWMPGIKRPWPEGSFYGFDRLADDAGIGYQGPDFGYWRIPDQAAMALLHEQELRADRSTPARAPRLVVFPTTTTHAPFHPIAPLEADWSGLISGAAPTLAQAQAASAPSVALQQPLQNYLQSMNYQYGWWSAYLRDLAHRPLVVVIVGDHQPPALVAGAGTPWDVPVHVIADDPALIRHLLAKGFAPGLGLPVATLGSMEVLTRRLLEAFEGHADGDLVPDPSLAEAPEPVPGETASVPGT